MSNTSETVPVLLDEQRTAERLDMTPASLRMDRHRGVGLPYVRIGRRIRADDVAAYLAANTVTPMVAPELAAAQQD